MHRRVSQPASKPEHPQYGKHSRKSLFLLGFRLNYSLNAKPDLDSDKSEENKGLCTQQKDLG
jgi:hypothetical protein